MKLKFTREVSIKDSLVFEEVFDENLQWDEEGKLGLAKDGVEFVYLVDDDTGDLIGEIYFITLDKMKDWEPDEEQPVDGLDPYYGTGCMYAFSTTILPKYQGKGFGKIMKAWYLSLCAERGFGYSLGHARDNGSIQLNKLFGGEVVGTFENWFLTGETVYLYIQSI